MANSRTAAILASLAGLACATKAPPVGIGPVYFDSASYELAYVFDYLYVGQAVERLQADESCSLALVGYADASGAEQDNQLLSEDRAEYVRSLVIEAGGADPGRVMTRGMGEKEASDYYSEEDRRVEFHFHCEEGDELPDIEQVLASSQQAAVAAEEAADLAASGGKKKKGDKSASQTSKADKARRERKDIVSTGLADMDSFFAKVQKLLDTLRGATDSIYTAMDNLEQALGVTEGQSLQSAMAQLKEQAAGSIKVQMQGTQPKLVVDSGLPPEARGGVDAINGALTSLGGAVKNLATIPNQAKGLINEAKALPAKVPEMAKSAGLSMRDIPKALKAVKQNVQVTTGIPGEAAEAVKAAGELSKLVADTFR